VTSFRREEGGVLQKQWGGWNKEEKLMKIERFTATRQCRVYQARKSSPNVGAHPSLQS
jgi:hypothetical protein